MPLSYPRWALTTELGRGESLNDSDKWAICNNNGNMTKVVQDVIVEGSKGQEVLTANRETA